MLSSNVISVECILNVHAMTNVSMKDIYKVIYGI